MIHSPQICQRASRFLWRCTRAIHNEAEAAREQAAEAAREHRKQATSSEVFDSHVKVLHRDRAALLGNSSDPLLSTVTERLLDRLEDCRKSFPHAVVLGGAAQQTISGLAGGRAGVERVTYVDTSQAMLDRVKALEEANRSDPSAKPWPHMDYVRMSDEVLPLDKSAHDLVISSLGLHWANDLPGLMVQCRLALRPDSLFLSAMFGGDTLQELRISCAVAQLERQGGVAPVVSPFAQVRDSGNLLTRAGLALPTVDVDEYQIRYKSALELVEHLRAMGESNGVVHRQRMTKRETALAAAAVYHSMFQEQDGTVPATYQVMFMTGWAPHSSQQKPAKRGSATVSFKELADGLVGQGATGGSTGEGGDEDPDACPTPTPDSKPSN